MLFDNHSPKRFGWGARKAEGQPRGRAAPHHAAGGRQGWKARPTPCSGAAVNTTWHGNGCAVYKDLLLQANLPLDTWPNSHAIN